jgi:protein TonB
MAQESSDLDLGLDLGDLTAGTGGGFIMEIPKFNMKGGDDAFGGDLDSPPTPVNKLQPIYPSSLLSKGIGGRVLITCTVDDTGRVAATSIKQSSGHPDLDKAALNAVNKWKFKPGTKAGRKIKATCVVPFNFEVKKN